MQDCSQLNAASVRDGFFPAVGIIALALVLNGCGGLPRPVEPLEHSRVPANWSHEQKVAPAVGDGWLSRYADAQLRALVQRMLAQNFDLQSTAAQVRSARLQVAIEASARLPEANAQLQGGRSKNGDVNPNNSAGAQVNVAWELDLWRKLRDNQAAAQLALSSTSADYHAVRLSLVASTARAWFDVLEARQLLQLLASRVRNLEENQSIIESRYHSGIGSSLDLYLVRTDVQQETARLIQQQQTLSERTRALQLVVGDYPSGEVDTAASQIPTLDDTVAAGLPADLVQRRPDIRAAYFSMQQANVEIAVAHKNRFPVLNLTANGGVVSDGLSSLLQNGNPIWSLLTNVAQPVFNGGRLRALEQQAKLTLVQREQLYLQTVYNAFSEVESALQNEKLLRQRYQAYVTAQSDAHYAENLAFEQYRSGLADFTTVLEAQRRALDTQVSVIQLRNQLIQNRIALHLALGSDFADGASQNALD